VLKLRRNSSKKLVKRLTSFLEIFVLKPNVNVSSRTTSTPSELSVRASHSSLLSSQVSYFLSSVPFSCRCLLLLYSTRISDVLVNNASQQIQCKNLADIDMDNVEDTFRVNIINYIGVSKAALPHMKRGDCMIMTTSVTAYKCALPLFIPIENPN
jgi:NAD(P)-dependent dehydrogenase (short-subunit alcohol dehydrogenase family)